MNINVSNFRQAVSKVRRSAGLVDELRGAQTELREPQPMPISNPEVLALIYTGANVIVDSSFFSALQRNSQAIAARDSKTKITFRNATMIDHLERLALSKSAPGAVYFDFS
ncbi:hypothetical protein HBO34_09040 [Pseudomonas veronii]|jgi:hypothetical protein|uniref:hypothetical protein n=1 Tax=Pseudomonas veronii TaxID=76761 RepID=UPI00147639F8|nr:hypothetical protein [Pseudomonas veronii]NMX38027.1 hypothetical protein [Pseudomonas veronii]